MRRIAFTILATISLVTSAFAQTAPAGARDAALAGAAAASVADIWSESNAAGWSTLEGIALAVHGAQLYGLQELRLGGMQVAVGVRGSSVVLGARTFGFADYRETVVTAGVAGPVRWGTFRPLHVGIRLRHHRTAFRTYGSGSAYAVSLGAIVPVHAHVAVGLAAENLYVAGGPFKSELPRRLHAGLSLQAGPAALHAAAGKDTRSPLTTRVGIEVRAIDALVFRIGYSLDPARFAGGVGLLLAPLTIDVAAERHDVLGWTPSCSVALKW